MDEDGPQHSNSIGGVEEGEGFGNLFEDFPEEILPDLTPIAGDLGYFLDSPELDVSEPLKSLPGHLEDDVQRMEISPMSGHHVISPLDRAMIGGRQTLHYHHHHAPIPATTDCSILNEAEFSIPELNNDVIHVPLKRSVSASTEEVPISLSRPDLDYISPNPFEVPNSSDLDDMWGVNKKSKRKEKKSTSNRGKGSGSKSLRKSKSATSLKKKTNHPKESLQEKRTKRLARNRLSARMSRQRKKVLLGSLQEKLQKIMKETTDLRQKCLQRMLTNYRKLDVNVSTYKGKKVLSSYYDKYLQTNMLPTLTKFLLWLVTSLWAEQRKEKKKKEGSREGSAANASSTRGESNEGISKPLQIWKLLVRELDLSEIQEQKIMAQMKSMNVNKAIPEIRKLLLGDKFIRHLRACSRSSAQRIEKLRRQMFGILKPEQVRILAKESQRTCGDDDKSIQDYYRSWTPKARHSSVPSDLIDILHKSDADVTSSDIRRLMTFAAGGALSSSSSSSS